MVEGYAVDLRDLLEAGCHFGHQARRWNPKMSEYIFTDRDGVHIFDLEKTAKKMAEAMEFVRDWVAQGREIVFVGTKRQAAAIVREETTKIGAPFVDIRWLGGTLTNWEEMQKRIKKLKEMKAKREAGEYATYTKKEQVLINREISKLERFFGGLVDLKGRPEALFVVDTHREETAVKEAVMIGIPVVGMVDTNADPDQINYIIPVNDDAVRSIKLVVAAIAQAYADGKALVGKVEAGSSKPVEERQVIGEKKLGTMEKEQGTSEKKLETASRTQLRKDASQPEKKVEVKSSKGVDNKADGKTKVKVENMPTKTRKAGKKTEKTASVKKKEVKASKTTVNKKKVTKKAGKK